MELLEDPKAEVVDEIAAKLGLRKVLRLFLSLREDLGSVLETSRWLAWPGLVWDCSRSDAGPARFEASLVFIRRLKKDASVGTVTCKSTRHTSCGLPQSGPEKKQQEQDPCSCCRGPDTRLCVPPAC